MLDYWPVSVLSNIMFQMLSLVKEESSVMWVTVAWVTVEGRIVENPPKWCGGCVGGGGGLSLLLLT